MRRQVYELFAGNCKPDDVLAAGKPEGKRGRFYSDLYYWLYWETENDRDRDRKPAFSKQCQNPSPMTIPGTWQKSTKKCLVGAKVKERSPAVCINRTLAQKTRLRVKIFVVSHRSSPINRVFESIVVLNKMRYTPLATDAHGGLCPRRPMPYARESTSCY